MASKKTKTGSITQSLLPYCAKCNPFSENEFLVGTSVRRELLDHVIVLNQRHLRRLLKDYVRYYHEDRTHLGLGKDTPGGRVVVPAVQCASKIISLPRLGGLHHRYMVAA